MVKQDKLGVSHARKVKLSTFDVVAKAKDTAMRLAFTLDDLFHKAIFLSTGFVTPLNFIPKYLHIYYSELVLTASGPHWADTSHHRPDIVCYSCIAKNASF